MSISSCRLDCGSFYADINRRKYAIDIDFINNPNYQQYTAGTTTNSITVSDGTGYLHQGNIGAALINPFASTVNANSQFQCLGFRLFFHKGYLKCVKKEIAMYNYVVTSGTSVNLSHPTIPKKMVRQSFYHPYVIWESIKDPEHRRAIQEEVCELARKFGIKIPKHFYKDGELYDGLNRSYYFAALDWLSYPLIREIDSPTLARNTIHIDRDLIAPKFEAMNFKQLVEHYYGTSTSKMLNEIFKVITLGGDYRKHTFPDPATVNGNIDIKKEFISRQEPNTVLRTMENEVWTMGDRHIQTLVFTLGPAILKSMGFDYFYQAIGKFADLKRSRGVEGQAMNYAGSPSKALVDDFSCLLKSVSPKKLLSALFSDTIKGCPDLHSLKDTANMLREYDSYERIPKTLRLQYPTGLVVDFKFKTLKELHDKISTQYTIIKTEASRKEIPVAEVYMKLDGMERNGLRLVVPTNTAQLGQWGKSLNICIASYGDSAARGSTLLLGVEKEEGIKYCIEFDELSIRRTKPLENHAAFITSENIIPKLLDANIVEETYPLLIERHAGVTPSDTKPEDEIYYMPSMVQFRGQRNGDPSKEDRADVENMLAQWVRDNREFLSSIKGIFDLKKNQWYGNNQYNAAPLNEDMIVNAVNHAAMNVQANMGDQIIMNPRAYADLQRALNPGNGGPLQVNANGQIGLAFGGIDVIVDRNVPRDEIHMIDRQGNRQVAIENINVD